MQLARLLEPSPRTLGAKLVEMGRALQIERRLSKDEILGAYLTFAPYGGNLEGVRAASLAYFGKEPTAPDRRRGGAAGRPAAGAGDGAAGSLPASGQARARQGAAPDAGARRDRRARRSRRR